MTASAWWGGPWGNNGYGNGDYYGYPYLGYPYAAPVVAPLSEDQRKAMAEQHKAVMEQQARRFQEALEAQRNTRNSLPPVKPAGSRQRGFHCPVGTGFQRTGIHSARR